MSSSLLHTPEGVRDIYGEELLKKLTIEDKIKNTVRSFGYNQIETPTFEFFDVFSKEIGTTPTRELYKFFDNEGNTLVLRPDFTPSIARCAAKYFCEETETLRFFYYGNTFTNTHNLQGKLKEFTELGAELINDGSVNADAEIICLAINSLLNVGLKDFRVCIGNVEFFDGLCEEAKLDKDTINELRAYIADRNYFAVSSLLEEKKVSKKLNDIILRLADMFNDLTSLDEAMEMVTNKKSKAAIMRLKELTKLLKAYDVLQYVSFDLGALSSFNYYTGITFKVYTYGVGDCILKGGRYDNLLSHFGKEAYAIGFAIVMDDLMDALSRQKIEIKTLTKSEFICYDKNDFDSLKKAYMEAKEKRKNNIAVTLIAK